MSHIPVFKLAQDGIEPWLAARALKIAPKTWRRQLSMTILA